MGKIEPKLSWALQRELEVRRSLGKSCSWAKGHRGARRAAELYAANLAAKRRMPSWSIVPQHVQEKVLEHVSLADLLNLRLAGFGGRDLLWRERLRSLFCARRDKLSDVMRLFASYERLRLFRLPSAASSYRPDQFSALEKLTLSLRGDRWEPPEVLEGIGEMHRLKCLTIASEGPVSSLPDSLRSCKELRVLCLSGLSFRALPPVVLDLAKLRALNLPKCARLEGLPVDMGERMQSLSKLDIRDCEIVRTLPDSLLHRLEGSKKKAPLLLKSSSFGSGYLNSVLDSDKYPRLRRSVLGNTLQL
jgi:hypothetical protein